MEHLPLGANGMMRCLRGEGILPLFLRVEGVPPSDRGQDARDMPVHLHQQMI